MQDTPHDKGLILFENMCILIRAILQNMLYNIVFCLSKWLDYLDSVMNLVTVNIVSYALVKLTSSTTYKLKP